MWRVFVESTVFSFRVQAGEDGSGASGSGGNGADFDDVMFGGTFDGGTVRHRAVALGMVVDE